MAKKTQDALGDLLDSSSGEVVNQPEAPSPVQNLPVASGKKRRGRPKKVREAAVEEAKQVESASTEGEQPTDLSSTVKQAVEAALKKQKPAGPTTRKGVAGLVKQLVRSEARKIVRESALPSPELANQVRDHIADQEKEEIRRSMEQPAEHPYWHLLRVR